MTNKSKIKKFFYLFNKDLRGLSPTYNNHINNREKLFKKALKFARSSRAKCRVIMTCSFLNKTVPYLAPKHYKTLLVAPKILNNQEMVDFIYLLIPMSRKIEFLNASLEQHWCWIYPSFEVLKKDIEYLKIPECLKNIIKQY